jgi:hypothetical protein
MRVLGVILAAIIVGTAVMLFVRRTYVDPRLRRRRTERLLEENEELDRQLDRLRNPGDKEG